MYQLDCFRWRRRTMKVGAALMLLDKAILFLLLLHEACGQIIGRVGAGGGKGGGM